MQVFTQILNIYIYDFTHVGIEVKTTGYSLVPANMFNFHKLYVDLIMHT